MTTQRFLPFLFFLFFSGSLFSAEIIEVLPLTNSILMVHFDEGYVEHRQSGELNTDETLVATPLDTANASNLSMYLLSSTGDPNYLTAQHPIDHSRKSKGTDYVWMCEIWVDGCVNFSPDVAMEHWVYLYLPFAMQVGQTYSLETGTLASNGSAWTFEYDPFELRSEAVHVNTIGYSTKAPEKYGYVYHWLGSKGGLGLSDFSGNSFYLLDINTGQIAYSGSLVYRADSLLQESAYPDQSPNGNFLGSEVYECNFSAFNTPGEYRLVVDGLGCSYSFSIQDAAYELPFQYVMKGIYQQRSGIPLESEYTDHPRPAPHNPLLTPGFENKLLYSKTRYHELQYNWGSQDDKPIIESGILGPLDTWGWYQDAGDWECFPSHWRIPVELMFLYEIAPNSFRDGDLNIPESGNDFPDLLDEAAWQLRFYHRTRHALLNAGYGTGGVAGGRVSADWFGSNEPPSGEGIGSWQDTIRNWVVLGEDAFMTYKYAGLAAHFAYILEKTGQIDPEGIDWTQEALDAWNWAQANTFPADYEPKHGMNLIADRLYAAASLYRLSGNPIFHNQFLADLPQALNGNGDPYYQMYSVLLEDWIYPVFIYLMQSDNADLDPDVVDLFESITISTSNFMLRDYIDTRACRWGGNYWFPMLVGQGTTPMVHHQAMAYAIGKKRGFPDATGWLAGMHHTADYFLGNNPLNMCWITGLGERQPKGIFHLDSWYSGSDVPRKGIVPYGPWLGDYSPDPIGPWTHLWAHRKIYPPIEVWPGHERWFDQRHSPLTCEFTIQQNLLPAAMVYGFLAADSISFEYTSGLDDLELDQKQAAFSLYPNPGNGEQLQLDLRQFPQGSMLAISIFDVLGRSFYTRELEGGLEHSLSILPGLPVGKYVVHVRNKTGVWSRVIVVE